MFSKLMALKILKYNEGNITIKDRPVVFMPVEILIFMQEHMEKINGKDEAKKFMIDAGKTQTKTGSKKYFLEKKDLARILSKVSMTGDPSLEMGREVLKFAGWGDLRIERFGKNKDQILVKTSNSPFAEEYLKKRGKSNQPVCHYLSGILLGVAESAYNAEYSVVEKNCRATGKSKMCIFEMKKKATRRV